jgi:hypothetical protein
VTWSDLDHAAVVATPSPVESERFGVTLARVSVGHRAEENPRTWQLLAEACRRPEDVLVVRWPSTLVSCAAVLTASGRGVLPAGSLTYWAVPAERLAAAPSPDDAPPPIVRADQVEPATLLRSVGEVFEGYVNHYAADPLLDRRQALEGYVDWVVRTLRGAPDAGAVLVEGGDVLGFGTWRHDRAAGHSEFLLGGIREEARGRGWYALLLIETARAALRAGLPTVLISTQGSNVGVQRAWIRLGFLPIADFATAHLVRRDLLSAPGLEGHPLRG